MILLSERHFGGEINQKPAETINFRSRDNVILRAASDDVVMVMLMSIMWKILI